MTIREKAPGVVGEREAMTSEHDARKIAAEAIQFFNLLRSEELNQSQVSHRPSLPFSRALRSAAAPIRLNRFGKAWPLSSSTFPRSSRLRAAASFRRLTRSSSPFTFLTWATGSHVSIM